MQASRPYALSIAGFDPSGGAGILADIKTFEQHQVYGFGVCSALTVQNDAEFLSVQWLDSQEIIAQIAPLMKFQIQACKIGIIQSIDVLSEVITYLKKNKPYMQIVFDPVMKASAGYELHTDVEHKKLTEVLNNIALITPNYTEVVQLKKSENAVESAQALAKYCAVLLKGGHNPVNPGVDFLYEENKCRQFNPYTDTVFPKHGSGCVLSAAIAANLAIGYTTPESCLRAKQYIEAFLNSNKSLLGYHYL